VPQFWQQQPETVSLLPWSATVLTTATKTASPLPWSATVLTTAIRNRFTASLKCHSSSDNSNQKPFHCVLEVPQFWQQQPETVSLRPWSATILKNTLNPNMALHCDMNTWRQTW
jgi:hypothetical protein